MACSHRLKTGLRCTGDYGVIADTKLSPRYSQARKISNSYFPLNRKIVILYGYVNLTKTAWRRNRLVSPLKIACGNVLLDKSFFQRKACIRKALSRTFSRNKG